MSTTRIFRGVAVAVFVSIFVAACARGPTLIQVDRVVVDRNDVRMTVHAGFCPGSPDPVVVGVEESDDTVAVSVVGVKQRGLCSWSGAPVLLSSPLDDRVVLDASNMQPVEVVREAG